MALQEGFFLGVITATVYSISKDNLRKNGPFSSFSMEIDCGRKSSPYYSPEV